MAALIKNVVQGGIAEELEIESGDKLLSINGNKLKDIIDYKFLICEEYLELEIEKSNGEIWSCELEKDYDEDLGIEFENSIIDGPKSCANNCIFCFIDQLPKGMRKTLYFKDDDSRLSFLQGNFVTLTNMSDSDIDRIIRYRISPINISVHTTDPELRVQMLRNKTAGKLMDRMKKLAAADIKMNCQIVTCPGINNGIELIKTVKDLYKLYPAVQNVAAVPIGVTKFRDGLYNVTLYNKETAFNEITNIKQFQEKCIKEIESPFIRLSDEFYVLAGIEVPKSDFYDDFHQIEDGVGMIRYLRNSIDETINDLDNKIEGRFVIPTGVSGYKEVLESAKKIEKQNPKIKIEVLRVENEFFGKTITVAGLLTGIDLYNAIKNIDDDFKVIIPANMLRSGENIFLDDMTLDELSEKLKKEIIVVEYTGENLIEKINENCKR
jgi:putative radical SAM enzyme (TIGR03279 family)